jgi:Xaa-Pro aminopeptidase
VLGAGNVIITEPGVYEERIRGGVRHEDDAVVTEGGAVLLATTDYDLDLG